MISKLVTVTCKNDFNLMIRQAESIQKFVAPCEHLVIIEDEDFDKGFWVKHLSKYYTNHTLVLKSYNNRIKIPQSGWVRQQALKLIAALDCDDEYLVLDSKDFFIRFCSLADWNGFTGSNYVEDMDYYFDIPNPFKKWRLKTSIAYSEYFNTDLLGHVFFPITPFVINTKYIDKNTICKQMDWFLRCFYNTGCEFIFYSYLAHDQIKTFKEHKFKSVKLCDESSMLSSFDEYVKSGLTKANEDENVMVVAIHRDLIANFTSEQTTYVNNWIRSTGLVTGI